MVTKTLEWCEFFKINCKYYAWHAMTQDAAAWLLIAVIAVTELALLNFVVLTSQSMYTTDDTNILHFIGES